MSGLQFAIGAEHAPIIEAAATLLLRHYKSAGIRAPAVLQEMAEWASVVLRGLSVAPLDVPVHDGPVAVLLSIPAAAAELGCSPSKVKRLIASGRLATVDFDGVRRIHRTDLDAYTDALRQRSPRERMTLKEAR